ncbi:MAG: hypothetical protein HC828_11940, partial [Blastochloris sp.]|nr:hypothetical protein [Blastochloris sp.]
MRIHDLRHTCATLLGERTSDRVIAAILGHTPGHGDGAVRQGDTKPDARGAGGAVSGIDCGGLTWTAAV